MSYPTYSRSVLRPWVEELCFREQGSLLTAIRGCDLTPKFPLDSTERQLVAALRYVIMNPADEREVGLEPGAFMQFHPPANFKPSALGHYPFHWVSHVMHASEIIGYQHPDGDTAAEWCEIYYSFCHSMHVPPEKKRDMLERLTEDRIAAGTVVQP